MADGVYTLTSAVNQAGTAMSTDRVDVREDFTVAFEVNLGASDGGADGVAVVFHNDARGTDAVGVHGTGLGVGGIENGLAIEFDTYNSSVANLTDSSMPGLTSPRTIPVSWAPTVRLLPRRWRCPISKTVGGMRLCSPGMRRHRR